MKTKIANYIRSGHPGIAIASHEEARVEAELKTIAAELGRPLHAWSATRGLVDTADGSGGSALGPLATGNGRVYGHGLFFRCWRA